MSNKLSIIRHLEDSKKEKVDPSPWMIRHHCKAMSMSLRMLLKVQVNCCLFLIVQKSLSLITLSCIHLTHIESLQNINCHISFNAHVVFQIESSLRPRPFSSFGAVTLIHAMIHAIPATSFSYNVSFQMYAQHIVYNIDALLR